jgi:hypothetical protein
MSSRTRWFTVALLAAAPCLLLVGCFPATEAEDPEHPTPVEQEKAQEYADEAAAALDEGDFDGALDHYTDAILWDATDPEIVMGYVSLNMADILADPAVVEYARQHLGIVAYPDTMSAILDYEGWMDTVTLYGSTETTLFPEISGQSDHDGDGYVDFYDRLMSMAEFAALHNDGAEDLMEHVELALGARLDLAIEAMDQYVTTDMTYAFTWEMFLDALPSEGEWPYAHNSLGEATGPIDVVVGQAEIQALAGYLEMMRGLVDLSRVYTLSFDLAGFWNYYGPEAEPGADRPEVPFSSTAVHQLFALQPDAGARLASARASFSGALGHFRGALDGIVADRTGQGFILASDSALNASGTASWWDNIVSQMRLEDRYVQEVKESLDDSTESTPAYLPLQVSYYGDAYTYYNGESEQALSLTTWVSTAVAGYVVEANFGAFFATPIALYGATGVVSLTEAGEPVYYEMSGSAPPYTFTEVTQATMDAFGDDFTEDSTVYCLRYDYNLVESFAPLVNLPSEMLDYMKDGYLYMPVIPAETAWNSFAPEGTGGWDSNGDPMVSKGSLWWLLMEPYELIVKD